MEFAKHVTNWDYNVQVTTDCLYDRVSNTAFKLQSADSHGLDVLNYEYVELGDGSKIRNFIEGTDDEFLNLNK